MGSSQLPRPTEPGFACRGSRILRRGQEPQLARLRVYRTGRRIPAAAALCGRLLAAGRLRVLRRAAGLLEQLERLPAAACARCRDRPPLRGCRSAAAPRLPYSRDCLLYVSANTGAHQAQPALLRGMQTAPARTRAAPILRVTAGLTVCSATLRFPVNQAEVGPVAAGLAAIPGTTDRARTSRAMDPLTRPRSPPSTRTIKPNPAPTWTQWADWARAHMKNASPLGSFPRHFRRSPPDDGPRPGRGRTDPAGALWRSLAPSPGRSASLLAGSLRSPRPERSGEACRAGRRGWRLRQVDRRGTRTAPPRRSRPGPAASRREKPSQRRSQ
jgi:hypothetical protein